MRSQSRETYVFKIHGNALSWNFSVIFVTSLVAGGGKLRRTGGFQGRRRWLSLLRTYLNSTSFMHSTVGTREWGEQSIVAPDLCWLSARARNIDIPHACTVGSITTENREYIPCKFVRSATPSQHPSPFKEWRETSAFCGLNYFVGQTLALTNSLFPGTDSAT